MSPPPIRAHIPQPRNVLPQFSPQIIFYFQTRQFGGHIEHGLRAEGAETRGGVDV